MSGTAMTRAGSPNMFSLALTYARREMRGGLKGFRIFLACLAMGVAAIAGVGSVSTAIVEGLHQDARVLLGADVDLRLTHIRATQEEYAWLKDNAARFRFRLSYPRDNPHGIAYEPWHWCWHRT